MCRLGADSREVFLIDSLTRCVRSMLESYVVVAGAVRPHEVARARSLLWRDIDKLWPGIRVNVSAPASAAGDGGAEQEDAEEKEQPEEQPPDWSRVIVAHHGITPSLTQSAGAWAVRGAPGVRRAFAAVWGCAEVDLITSMDCVILWKPWGGSKANRKPVTEGMHLDQNPCTTPRLECVQGMVPLLEVTSQTGGLSVVPDSNSPAAQVRASSRQSKLCVGCGSIGMHDPPTRQSTNPPVRLSVHAPTRAWVPLQFPALHQTPNNNTVCRTHCANETRTCATKASSA